MPMLERNQLVLVKVETTSGVDAVPTAALNAINCAPIEWSYDPESISRIEVNRSLEDPEQEQGRKLINYTIKCSVKGSGTAGTPPQYSALMQACAYSETVVAATSVTYAPSSTTADHKTITTYIYEDGKLLKIVGAMGNWSVAHNAGQISIFTFSMQGKFLSQTDAAVPSSPTFEATTAVICQSAGISFGSWNAAKVRSLSFASGNKIIERKDCNATDGLDSLYIGGRNPTFQASVEAELEATKPFFGNVLNGTKEAIDCINGTVAGNIVTFSAPKAKTNTIAPSKDNGINLFSLSGQCRDNAGDDGLVITLT